MSINIGGAIIPLISAFAAHWWLAGGDAGTGDDQHGIRHLVNAAPGKERPAKRDWLPVGAWHNDPLELRQERQSPPMGLWQMLRTTMLKNPMIWLLGVLCAGLPDPHRAQRLGQHLADGEPRRQSAVCSPKSSLKLRYKGRI